MQKRLEGKVALITGASRGIGRELALAFAREGADIVVAAKSTESTERLPGSIHTVAKEIEALGRKALPVSCNVREEEEIQNTVSKAYETFGHIDILVNNAGALWWEPVLNTPSKRFDLIMDVNARGAFLCAQAVLPGMIRQDWGHIINMSPPVDLRVLPGRIGYFISKFGMTMLSLGLPGELQGKNVAVNSLWPVTIMESQASINWGLGDKSTWRKASIMADAALAVVTKEPKFRTGKALLDEDVLREEGVTDFSKYACVPGTDPAKIRFKE